MSRVASARRSLTQSLDTLRRFVVKPTKGLEYLKAYAASPAGTALGRAPACDLERIFTAHDGRVVHKWQHYLAVYDRLVGPYRAGMLRADGTRRPLRFLEIGVSKGGSLQMWRTFLGPDAILFGVDVDPACTTVADPGTEVRIGSQGDADFLRRVVAEMGGIDIVLDDGSHIGEHQRVSFETLFPILSDGGLYMLEDLHTSYWPEWRGGHRRRDTGIEICKDLVDSMHGWYHDTRSFYPAAKQEIASIEFLDSITAIQKRRREPPLQVVSGRAAMV